MKASSGPSFHNSPASVCHGLTLSLRPLLRTVPVTPAIPFGLLALVVTLCLFAPQAAAQTPTWEENFRATGVNGSVNAIVETADAYYYGGDFTYVGIVAANHLARVDKTTGAVTPLGSATQNGTDYTVYALAISGTDLFVGGGFVTVSSSTQNAISANSIARWSTTGNTWTPLGSAAQNGTDYPVYALTVSGTNLFVGGFFDTVSSSTQNAISAHNIARWSTTGGTWSPLGSAAQNGTNGTDSYVTALAVSGTDLFVGGFFATVSSSTQNAFSAHNIARWSTTGNTWSRLGSAAQNGTAADVSALTVSGTDLFVGGYFTSVSSSTQNAISANSIAKWSTTGSTWSPLGSAAQNGVAGNVNALAISGTDLFVGGGINYANDSTQPFVSANGVAKWSTTGNIWSPLGSETQNGTDGSVNALVVSGTDLFVGGYFTTVSSITQSAISANYIAKWNIPGDAWAAAAPTTTGDGISGTVFAVVDAGTVVYVGGSFSHAGNVAAKNVACWDKVNHTWSPLGSAGQNGTDYAVYALAVIGTDLYVGGSFSTVSDSTQGAISASNIARWSTTGSTWSPLGSETQNGAAGFAVTCLAVNGTNLFVGGYFTTVSSSTQSAISANRVAKWSTTGGTWSPLGSAAQNGTDNDVFALAMSGTDLFVGGQFSAVSSSTQDAISANNIARWSTTGSTWSSLGDAALNGTENTVYALAVIGTDIYAAGEFTTVSSSTQDAISANTIARWSTGGSTWSPLGSATQNGTDSEVHVLAVSGTDLFVGGYFFTVSSSTQNALPVSSIARWSTTESTWSPLGSLAQNGTETDRSVYGLAVGGADLFVGGNFTTASSSTQNAISDSGFGIFGIVPTAPEIAIRGNGVEIANGDTTPAVADHSDFGSAGITGNTAVRIFTIANLGTAALNLTGTPKVAISGTNAADFTVTTQPVATVAVLTGTTTFQITFDPSALGTRSAAVSIANNDSDENPYTFSIQGTGTLLPPTPEIVVEQPANTNLTDGAASIDFGSVFTNSTTDLGFTIKNTGNADLTGLTITKDGAGAAFFTVVANPTAPVVQGDSTTFTVRFAPTSVGAKTAKIHIASNDADESPFDITLTGTGLTTVPGALAVGGALFTVNEEAGTINIPVTRTGGTDGAVSVKISTSNGTALAGSDYGDLTGQLVTFASGDNATKNVPITILNPAGTNEVNETFTVTLSSPTGGATLGAQKTATVVILDFADTTPPGTPTISTPLVNAKLNANPGGPVTVTGTAIDNQRVTSVEASLDNGATFTPAVVTLTGTGAAFGTTATYTVNVIPIVGGTSTVLVRTTDRRGNVSTTLASRSFVVLRPLAVNFGGAGSGTVTAGFAPTSHREVGKTYTITATPNAAPAPGLAFDGWTVSGGPTLSQIGVTDQALLELRTLTFVFRENLVLTAKFIQNPFTPALTGAFNGLITPSGGSPRSNETVGKVTATVLGTGAFSGTLYIDGMSLGFAGVFNNAGTGRFGTNRASTFTVVRTTKPSYILTLNLKDLVPADPEKIRLEGTLTQTIRSTIKSVSDLKAGRAYYNGSTVKVPPNLAGTSSKAYTVYFPAKGHLNDKYYPQGDGYATVSVNINGTVSVVGRLADGTAISASAPLSKNALSKKNEWPLFQPLYPVLGVTKGCIAGQITLDDTQQPEIYMTGTDLLWFRPFQLVQWYPYGWDEGILVDLMGAQYVVPPATPATSVFPGPGPATASKVVDLTFDALLNVIGSGSIIRSVNISPTNVVTKPPSNTDASFTLTLTPSNGIVTGTVTHTDGTKPTFQGVIIQKGTQPGAYGYFLSKQPAVIDYTGESGGFSAIGK